MTLALLVSRAVTVCLQQVLQCEQRGEGSGKGRGHGRVTQQLWARSLHVWVLGKEMPLLIPECGVGSCAWTREQSLLLRKETNPEEHPFGMAPSCLLMSLEDNEVFVTAQGSREPKQPRYELSRCKSAGSAGC